MFLNFDKDLAALTVPTSCGVPLQQVTNLLHTTCKNDSGLCSTFFCIFAMAVPSKSKVQETFPAMHDRPECHRGGGGCAYAFHTLQIDIADSNAPDIPWTCSAPPCQPSPPSQSSAVQGRTGKEGRITVARPWPSRELLSGH